MIIITLTVAVFFILAHIQSSLEPDSYDSGTNLLVSSIMVLIVCIMIGFVALRVSVDEQKLHIVFGYGIYKKSFLLSDVVSAISVRNKWYYGW